MTMEGGDRILKFLVFFFNSLFFIFGIVLIAVGSWAEVQYGDFIVFTSINYATGSRLVIAVGVLIALISFFGCFGAIKENKIMLIIFFVLLCIILALEISGAAVGYTHRAEIKTKLKADIKKAMQHDYGKDVQKGVTKAIDALQKKEQCCGINNYTDWFRSEFTGGSHTKVPDSCCKSPTKDCGNPIKQTSSINSMGCYEKMAMMIRDKLYVIGAFAITLVVIQFLGMIFALVLICKVGKNAKGTLA